MGYECLTKDQIGMFQDAFNEFDINHDGIIDTKQLRALMRQIGLNPTEAELQVYTF